MEWGEHSIRLHRILPFSDLESIMLNARGAELFKFGTKNIVLNKFYYIFSTFLGLVSDWIRGISSGHGFLHGKNSFES
jgi:hypothetical protein